MNKKERFSASDFDRNYYHYCCGEEDYVGNRAFADFFQFVAKKIKKQFNPKVVLDAGCACGHLVAALRDLGIEAYGIDISEYAISQVREDIKPYCAVASLPLVAELPESFPKRYDLVTNFEVLEHMHEEDSFKSIAFLCKYSDTIFFSSTPDDTVEPTHVNVQPISYWVENFGKNNFFPYLDINTEYLTLQAMVFKRSGNVQTAFSSFVDNWWKERQARIDCQKVYLKLEDMTAKCNQLQQQYKVILNSRSWQITKPVRVLLSIVKGIFEKKGNSK